MTLHNRIDLCGPRFADDSERGVPDEILVDTGYVSAPEVVPQPEVALAVVPPLYYRRSEVLTLKKEHDAKNLKAALGLTPIANETAVDRAWFDEQVSRAYRDAEF